MIKLMKRTWPDAHTLCVISRSDCVATNGKFVNYEVEGMEKVVVIALEECSRYNHALTLNYVTVYRSCIILSFFPTIRSYNK